MTERLRLIQRPDPFLPVTARQVILAILMFGVGLAAAVAVALALPVEEVGDIGTRGFALILGVVLSPCPFLSALGFLRQESLFPFRSVPERHFASAASGFLFGLGWYPLSLATGALSALAASVSLEIAEVVVFFIPATIYFVLGPIMIPIGIARLLQALSADRLSGQKRSA